jgi:hypothetical protein
MKHRDRRIIFIRFCMVWATAFVALVGLPWQASILPVSLLWPVMFFMCCCECTVSCDACADSTGPCEWQVDIAGVTDGTCPECDELNTSFVVGISVTLCVSIISDPCCQWNGSDDVICGVGSGETTVSVMKDIGGASGFGVDHYLIICLTRGIVNWIKDYGMSPPECLGINGDTIPFEFSGGGHCNFGSATCALTAL